MDYDGRARATARSCKSHSPVFLLQYAPSSGLRTIGASDVENFQGTGHLLHRVQRLDLDRRGACAQLSELSSTYQNSRFGSADCTVERLYGPSEILAEVDPVTSQV